MTRINIDDEARTPLYSSVRGRILAEALPWIEQIAGKTIVIKYGGAAMVDPLLRRHVMDDIVMLKLLGVRPVLVHGGGKAVSSAMEARGMTVEFRDGLRVTSPEAMEVVREVLVGTVNPKLVSAMNEHGALGVGLCGMDANTVIGEPLAGLGRTGTVKTVNAAYLLELLDDGYVPVLSSVASDGAGDCLNVNADVVAGEVAQAVGAQKLVYLTDVDGIYLDFSDKSTLLSRVSLSEARDLLAGTTLTAGMRPKLSSLVAAVEAGVPSAHIISGMRAHSLLVEMLTNDGVGTMVYA